MSQKPTVIGKFRRPPLQLEKTKKIIKIMSLFNFWKHEMVPEHPLFAVAGIKFGKKKQPNNNKKQTNGKNCHKTSLVRDLWCSLFFFRNV